MNLNDALGDIACKLTEHNRRELLAGLPILAEQDRTWGQ